MKNYAFDSAGHKQKNPTTNYPKADTFYTLIDGEFAEAEA